MNALPGASRPVERGKGAAGPYAPKLRALWIAGWNLGVVQNRSDEAMHAFVRRQTGIEHTRFLRDHEAAAKAIEALKAWLARKAGVEWPKAGSGRRDADWMALKHAVLSAQVRRAETLAGLRLTDEERVEYLENLKATKKVLDAASATLGRVIRKAVTNIARAAA